MAELLLRQGPQRIRGLDPRKLASARRFGPTPALVVSPRRQQHGGHRADLQNDGRRLETMSREETAQLAARQQKFIRAGNALLRIKNKTYGVCRVTNKLIPRASPTGFTPLSIEAKQRQ